MHHSRMRSVTYIYLYLISKLGKMNHPHQSIKFQFSYPRVNPMAGSLFSNGISWKERVFRIPFFYMPHQWTRGCTVKTGQQKALSSIPNRANRPNSSEFSRVFLRNSPKCGLGSLRKTPMEGTLPSQAQVPHVNNEP